MVANDVGALEDGANFSSGDVTQRFAIEPDDEVTDLQSTVFCRSLLTANAAYLAPVNALVDIGV